MGVFQAGGGLYAYSPYCGAPPEPATLLWRWNLDPILLTLLATLVIAYAVLAERGPGQRCVVPPWRRTCFYGGWSLAAAALISPLCALSVSLFSARVSQHMVLEIVAAPLVALGRPAAVFASAWRGHLDDGRLPAQRSGSALAAAGVFAAVLWCWHAPGPYTATFESDFIYWLMHATSFGAALWLWSALLQASRDRLGEFLAAALVTTLQMGFLGAVITFGARPLYRVHWGTTVAWDLTPLQDQQLGGLIMWIPAGAIFLAAIITPLTLALQHSPTRASAAAQA